MENKSAEYLYDFGDNWEHKILLEKIIPKNESVRYPVCIASKQACPPEDSGGVWRYDELLEAMKNPKHEEHEESLE